MNTAKFTSIVENMHELQHIVGSRVSNPVITGSSAVCIHQYLITRELPTIIPSDVDFLTSDGARMVPELPKIGNFRRVQETQHRSCTYACIQTFDLTFGERVDSENVNVLGYTICVEKLDKLLKRYMDNQMEIYDESSQVKIDILKNIQMIKATTCKTNDRTEPVKRGKGLFSDFDDD